MFLAASSRPEQNCKNEHPNDTPAEPCDVRISCLPFEDFLWMAIIAMPLSLTSELWPLDPYDIELGIKLTVHN